VYVCGIVGFAIAMLPDLVNALDGLGVISLSGSDELVIKQIKWYVIVPVLVVFYSNSSAICNGSRREMLR